MGGFSTAISELSLVVFSTLLPSGALAVLCMGLLIVMGRVDEAQHVRIDQMMGLPLGLSMLGLIIAATHLGTPSNALYVLTGVGRSPLSNEVACTVVFLGLTGTYWLYSFALRPSRRVQRIWMAVVCFSALATVQAIALAYAVPVVITWNLPSVPLALWLNALVGGPSIALASLVAADCAQEFKALCRLLATVACGALLVNVAVYGLQGMQLTQLSNELVAAAELVPGYGVMVAAFFVLCAVGLGIDVRWVWGGRQPVRRDAVVAALLVLLGVFVMRFAFYMTHMTVGLGV